jgi:hypothetical protein
MAIITDTTQGESVHNPDVRTSDIRRFESIDPAIAVWDRGEVPNLPINSMTMNNEKTRLLL